MTHQSFKKQPRRLLQMLWVCFVILENVGENDSFFSFCPKKCDVSSVWVQKQILKAQSLGKEKFFYMSERAVVLKMFLKGKYINGNIICKGRNGIESKTIRANKCALCLFHHHMCMIKVYLILLEQGFVVGLDGTSLDCN